MDSGQQLTKAGGKKRHVFEHSEPFLAVKEAVVMQTREFIESGDKRCLLYQDGTTLLHVAAQCGLMDSVQQLIKAGGKKLLFATDMNGREAAAQILINVGGRELIFTTENNGASAFICAAQHGHAGIAKDLVEKGGACCHERWKLRTSLCSPRGT